MVDRDRTGAGAGAASSPASGSSDAPPLPAGYSNTKALGRLIYTDYVYPFEIAAVILLVAIVAAIALTLRRRKDTTLQRSVSGGVARKRRTGCG